MIYAQPNSWQCGPFALKHALLVYGRVAHEDALASLAGSNESIGTDELGLRRALEAYGGTLRIVRRRTRHGARQELHRWLRQGIPVLLCVDQWDHWITAVADLHHQVALFDSHFDNAVFRREPWDRLLDRVAYRRRHLKGLWTTAWWDLHPVLLPEAVTARRIRPDRLATLFADGNPDQAVAAELLGAAGVRHDSRQATNDGRVARRPSVDRRPLPPARRDTRTAVSR